MPAVLFYLPSSGAASVSPAFGSLWENIADADRVAMDTTPSNTSFLNKSAAETTLGLVDTLARQFVGPANLPGGSVEGTFRLIVPASESTFAADAWLQCRIAVYSSDGTTHRGDLFSGVTTTTVSASNTDPNYEISTSTLTRILSGTLTPVDAQPGDRIVLEIGYRCTNPTTAARSVDFRFGDLTASVDYAFTVDLSPTGNPRPWIEFDFPSNNPITLAGEGQRGASSLSLTANPFVSLSGQGRRGTADFDLLRSAELELSGEGQRGTASISLTSNPFMTLNGVGQRGTTANSFVVDVPDITFTPPTEMEGVDHPFWGRYQVPVGKSVIKRDGTFVAVRFPWLGELTGEPGVDFFLGGRTYTITAAVAAELEADGFDTDNFTFTP